MSAAYEALSEKMKARLGDLKAAHNYTHLYGQSEDGARPALTEEQRAKVPVVAHPVVRSHPETGLKALYVSPGLTVRILDMEAEESRDLLAELHEHSTKPEFGYRHQWRRHDVVFWDNRCTMHLAAEYDPKYTRHMHRTTVKGNKPF